MRYDRGINVKLQGGSGLKRDHKTAFPDQVDKFDLISSDSTNTEKEFFIPGQGEQIHHIVPLRTYDGLFANTNEEQALALAELLGSGNRIENLFVTPNRVHQAGVHNLLKDAGLEIKPKGDNSNLHPLIKQMEQSHDIPYADKLALAKKVKKELVPLIKEELNEAMSRYGDYEDELHSAAGQLLDLIRAGADTPEATARTTDTVQRMAQNILQSDKVGRMKTRDVDATNMKRFAADNDLARAIMASMREESPGDNRDRALVVDSGGGDVTIGQGVLRNGKNGNGHNNGAA